jgi:hypothetical protein
MTELEKYETINKTETVEELENAVETIWSSDYIDGMTRKFDKKKMKGYIKGIVDGSIEQANVLTRKYGLRQQALYLKWLYS